MGIIFDNPVLRREMRQMVPRWLRHLAGWKRLAFTAALTSVLFAGGAYLQVLTVEKSAYPNLGANFYAWMWAAMALVAVPGYTSRAITRERLQGTWDALVLTRLRPGEVFFGKLLAPLFPAWSVGLLLLPMLVMYAASAPSPALQNASLASVAFAYAFALIAVPFFAAVGLLASARFRESYASMGVVYGFMLFSTVVVPLVGHLVFAIGFRAVAPLNVVTQTGPYDLRALTVYAVLSLVPPALLLPIILALGPAWACRSARVEARSRAGGEGEGRPLPT